MGDELKVSWGVVEGLLGEELKGRWERGLKVCWEECIASYAKL